MSDRVLSHHFSHTCKISPVVGPYTAIVGVLLCLLFPVVIAAQPEHPVVSPGIVRLETPAPEPPCRMAWAPVTTRAQGTPLTNLAGYRLYTASTSQGYTKGQPTHTFPVGQLADPKAPEVFVTCARPSFWVATAYDSTGEESAFSNELYMAALPPETPPGGPVPPVTPVAPRTATASGAQKGHPASAAIDGTLDTYWAAKGRGQWLQIDLGAVQSVAQVQIAFLRAEARQARFTITVSSDGKAWQQVLAGGRSGPSQALQPFALPAGVAARYVRIVGQGNNLDPWNSYREVVIDGGH